MIRHITVAALAGAALFTVSAAAQDKTALSRMVADLRLSLAQNQAQLRKLSWTETREISLKGEVKKREQFDCSYDAAGKLQKAPVGAAAPKQAPKGLKGKVVANKLEELKEYMDRVGSLVRRYVPPDPQAMKAAFDAGKASLSPAPDGTSGSLVFRDYAKPGDQVSLTLDMKTKQIRSFQVATYLDSPGDTVSLDAAFTSLPSGVSYMERSVLNATAKEIQIKTTNFGHHQ